MSLNGIPRPTAHARAVTVDMIAKRRGVVLFVDSDDKLAAWPMTKVSKDLADAILANRLALCRLLLVRAQE